MYAVRMWNKHAATIAGWARTNNTCEGFNSSFSADIEPFPSLWRVIMELQKRDRLAEATAKEEFEKVCFVVIGRLVFG